MAMPGESLNSISTLLVLAIPTACQPSMRNPWLGWESSMATNCGLSSSSQAVINARSICSAPEHQALRPASRTWSPSRAMMRARASGGSAAQTPQMPSAARCAAAHSARIAKASVCPS
ncbi:hypothetical protein D9M71_648850 [compost metagenome]